MWIRFSAIVCLLVISPAVGYQIFQSRIPNGNRVPHPCRDGELWAGVGHFNDPGGGSRNPFGQDFAQAGNKWTKKLCQKDSDGDGKTNGQELGDPDCTWQLNATLKLTSGLSHPGVCQPLDSPHCKQRTLRGSVFKQQSDWMEYVCKHGESFCEGLDNPDVKKLTFRLPNTPVPAKETTYVCIVFDPPDNESDVHLIATMAVIDNKQVLHHMVLFGCKGVIEETYFSPFTCEAMSAHDNCFDVIGVHNAGQKGECSHKNTGIRLGPKGFTNLALQFHWNNPERSGAYHDSSGLALYYTRKLRPYDEGLLMIGNNDFVIPPKRQIVEVTSLCTPVCTKKMMNASVYVTAALNHMHALGVSQWIQLYRNGIKLRDITNDVKYKYGFPEMHTYPTPFELRPGDELRTICLFNSMSRNKTTTFGLATHDEMCYGALYYYPAQAIAEPSCFSFRSVSQCDPSTMKGCSRAMAPLMYLFFKELQANCVFHTCYDECKDTIKRGRESIPCLADKDVLSLQKKFIWPKFGLNVLKLSLLLSSCDNEACADKLAMARSNADSVVTYSLPLIALSIMLS